MKEKSCCFTGHRKIPTAQYQSIVSEVEITIEKMIKDGYKFFYAGGALGFDTIAENAVLKLKKKYPEICLILILPCPSQAKYWSEGEKKDYENIKLQADKVVFTSETYTRSCMLKRNRQLVDSSSACICYLTKISGGTFYTANQAAKSNLTIINIADRI